MTFLFVLFVALILAATVATYLFAAGFLLWMLTKCGDAIEDRERQDLLKKLNSGS